MTTIRLNSKPAGQLLVQVQKRLDKGRKTIIFTPNPEFVVLANKDLSFRRILNEADFNLADGSYLFWADYLQTQRQQYQSYFNKTRAEKAFLSLIWAVKAAFNLHCGKLAEKRVTGTDFMFDLLKLAADRGWPVFFLGAKPGVAYKAATKLKKQLPELRVAGCFAGDGSPRGDRQTVLAVEKCALHLKTGRIKMLFVAYGMDKQERWIERNMKNIPVDLAMGVGGAFDYYSGQTPRAPNWLRKRGGEWLYRLIRQPWRWRRQLALTEFVWLVLRGRIVLAFGK